MQCPYTVNSHREMYTIREGGATPSPAREIGHRNGPEITHVKEMMKMLHKW